jgi:hypothetical protein
VTMAEETLAYHGFVETESYGNPSLVRATSGRARERAKREYTGGVIFLNEEDMPSLQELMARGEIKSAVVIESAAPVVDESLVRLPHADWRIEAGRRLRFNAEIADQTDVMDEDYVFLSALPDDDLDDVLSRAEALLGDRTTTEATWDAFLDREAERASTTAAHDPIPLPKDERQGKRRVEEPSWRPLISLESLGVEFTRGAVGGPRPLGERTNA